MRNLLRFLLLSAGLFSLVECSPSPRGAGLEPSAASSQILAEKEMRRLLDAPLLFVKRHSYKGIHIYDTYYKWPPGGGGIYVLENPAAPSSEWKIRPVIDPTTPHTLGMGVYTSPELSWDAKRILFCFKGSPEGNTSIYEIGLDGQGLRRVTDPSPTCVSYKGTHSGQHDIEPAYLPDGRIVFLSTRPSGLVPCANEGVGILHVMNADGSDIHPISVNNVNEFDPAVLNDGRIVFGRWEYVDKTALTQQSLWTIHPDGTSETALFANNMVFPEAILDARPVPGSHRIVGVFTPHNAPPRGAVAFIDPRLGKNNPEAITNLEYPDQPTRDRGHSSEPWPLSEDVVLFSGRPKDYQRNVLEIMDSAGHRMVLHSDPEICLHSPMLVKPRKVPPVLVEWTDRSQDTGRFFVQNIYEGLTGVEPGDVKWLRVIEETSRVSPQPGGKNPYNQTFLVSGALAFSVKNFLGVVPVEQDGSVYLEAPSGRALYLQALDEDGRLIQSMRTFVQAAPGTMRSCIGCHEHKDRAAVNTVSREVLQRSPRPLRPETWGSGYIDYPSMIQPILDRHCVSCHGGQDGIAGGMDLTGGWTEHFNISYENLTSRRESQLTAYWIAGIDCMNGTAHWSAKILPPRSHGSGVAPLANLIMDGHHDSFPNLTREERDLLFAWIDSNGLYHGTWNYTEHGCSIPEWSKVRNALSREMETAGCTRCHAGKDMVFESDWFNLKDPELSRILRAPMSPGEDGLGLGLCRDRKFDPQRQRVRILREKYEHAVKPLEEFTPQPMPPGDTNTAPMESFVSTEDPHYQSMLAIIRNGREKALASPRVDMPGAEILAGASRHFAPPPLPETAPPLQARLDDDGVVQLAWEGSAAIIGLEAELHRSSENNFQPRDDTLLTRTRLFRGQDAEAAAGPQYYALNLVSLNERSRPSYATVTVSPARPPSVPLALKAISVSGAVRLQWEASSDRVAGYHVYRAIADTGPFEKLNSRPVRTTRFADTRPELGVDYAYRVTALSRRHLESAPSRQVVAAARLVEEPVFAVEFGNEVKGFLDSTNHLDGLMHGEARCEDNALNLVHGGHVTFPHMEVFDLSQPLTIDCWVQLNSEGQSPVIASCGEWRKNGWFLQRLGNTWRWHVGGIDCDGGTPVHGEWTHLVAMFDGKTARLFQDGMEVAEQGGEADTTPSMVDLMIGQYSAGPGEAFQVTGRIERLRIYHRLLTPDEITRAAQSK